jgi:hypothetical protein
MDKTKIEIEIDSEHLKQLYIAQKEYEFAELSEFIEFYMILGHIKTVPFIGIDKQIKANPNAVGDELKTFIQMYMRYVTKGSKIIEEQIKSGKPIEVRSMH